MFGATWSGRKGTVEDAAQTAGPFLNTLPIRVNVDANPTVRELLAALRTQHRATRSHEHTPLTAIQSAAGTSARMFETLVVFDYQRFHATLTEQDARWANRRLSLRSQTGYALCLTAHLEAGELLLEIDYESALYDSAQADQLLEHYSNLLRSMANSESARVLDLTMLDPIAFDRLTAEETQRETSHRAPSTVDRILEQCQQRGESAAVQAIDGAALSYADLGQRSTALAKTLLERGLSQGDIVALVLPRSIDAVVAMLAVQIAGGAFLPIDPANPADRIHYLLEDSAA